ncbi:hypothetical protein CC2G_011523 [Coprinopsis cinerea AmutBmut pab1-1]|nr:hypothetical protein CC2G_011523 [Coprinopsis cinerea AmutBmut pab1-1]
MHLKSFLSSVILLASVVANAFAVSQDDSSLLVHSPGAEYRPADFLVTGRETGLPTKMSQRRSTDFHHLTNADRLARRLPLKPPVRKSSRRAAVQRPSPGPIETIRGKISVVNDQGQSMDSASALTVSLSVDSLQSSPSQVRVTFLNSKRPEPYLGLVQGRDNVGDSVGAPDSFNYLYLNSIAEPGTAPGSAGSNAANSNAWSAATRTPRIGQSDVWTFDRSSNRLIPYWINPDLSSYGPIEIYTQSNVLYVLPNPGGFMARFPSPLGGPYHLVFVPDAPIVP